MLHGPDTQTTHDVSQGITTPSDMPSSLKLAVEQKAMLLPAPYSLKMREDSYILLGVTHMNEHRQMGQSIWRATAFLVYTTS